MVYGDASVTRRSYALLLCAQDDLKELRELLASHGWDAVVASDPGELLEHARFAQCAVGIAAFNDEHAVDPGRLSSAIAESKMEWLALTTATVAALPQFACLLANAFFDFHTLPLDPQRIVQALGHAHGKAMLRRRLREITVPIRGRYGMVGTSPAMLDMYRLLDKFVRVDAPVLINGESGTGKELAALAVHRESARRNGPFVPVNCGAIPPALIQSQLFGHEKGAFTGAHQRQTGSLEAANGGTIFLDEIGDLPLESQASLLRFLQESTIVRVGSTKTIAIDARVVAATHVDLGAAVRAGRFREDLFYRLNVLHLDIPPLRERVEDLPLLVEHVLEVHRAHMAPGVRGLSSGAYDAMRAHRWPGNVRELINRVHRAMIMCEGTLITAADLGLESARIAAGPAAAQSLADARQDTERDLVLAALDRNTYNMAATARELGVSRVTLYRLAQRLAIKPRSQRLASNMGRIYEHGKRN